MLSFLVYSAAATACKSIIKTGEEKSKEKGKNAKKSKRSPPKGEHDAKAGCGISGDKRKILSLC